MTGDESGAPLDHDWNTDHRLSLRLDRAWPAFFARFGRLSAVQRAVVEPILAGKSVLVCAPTAAGKTEAACAPLMERFVRSADSWTVLYVSPTRALVNDLFERLQGPVGALGLRIARRTGDYHDDLVPVPNVLLTTPESFDSLLCRGRDEQVGHVLAHVAAVVLDEIHLMHGSARDEQLRWLLERLRRLCDYAVDQGWARRSDVQIVGLSATVPAPENVLNAYFPSDALLVALKGGREIDLVSVDDAMLPLEDAVPRYVSATDASEKVLVFCNARKRVDALAAEMAPRLESSGYLVKGHHGSLSQVEREQAERSVKRERKIVLFATSTLEIGVDIGDIDLVVLDGPPPDIAAFLQRIGRGNRRTMRTRVMLCAETRRDEIIQSAMLEAARVSYLGPAESGPQYAVGRQQLASYVFQGSARHRSQEMLLGLARSAIPADAAVSLLNHMLMSSELVADRGGIRLGDEWLDKTGGDIHSNIEGQPGYTVTGHATGDAIAVGVRYGGGKRLAIAGNKLQVTGIGDHHLEVRRTHERGPTDAQWSYATSTWVKGASQPQAVRRYLGFEENVWPLVPTTEGLVVFHFGGARRRACLELLARRAGLEKQVGIDDFCLRLPSLAPDKPRWLVDVGPAMLDVAVAGHLTSLERSLGRPKVNARLPNELRIAEVREWLNVGAQLTAIQESLWQQTTDPMIMNRLLALTSH